MCHWIREAWYDMPCDIIVKSFKICDLIWEEGTGGVEEPAIVLPEDVCENEDEE